MALSGVSARRLSGAAPWLAVIVCAGPALIVLALAVTTSAGEGAAAGALIGEAILGLTAALALGGTAACALGVAAAALTALCAFPGRAIFAWALAAPLAAPAYVLAFAYAAIAGPGGVFPFRLEGLGGLCFVYAIGFYPYVYLAARASFAVQSAQALEAARTLGDAPLRAFVRVGLPMAWPGIAAGAALVGMEIAADYGAAAHFGVITPATAAFRAWFSHGDPGLALRIAAGLLLVAAGLLALERGLRSGRGFAGGGRPMARIVLRGWAAMAAFGLCLALTALGLLLPVGWLLRLALFSELSRLGEALSPLLASLGLASLGAAVTLVLAIPIALAAQTARSAAGRAGLLAAGVGYASPGAVLALGVLAALAQAREAGLIAGFGAGLALAALLWTLAARFCAAGLQPIEAGLSRISASVRGAAMSLGAGPWRRALRIELPLAGPSLFAAAAIVFVEILRELPATLILRPFGFETLAVRAHVYASDDRLIEAAWPALMIVLAGLLPMVWISRRMEARP